VTSLLTRSPQERPSLFMPPASAARSPAAVSAAQPSGSRRRALLAVLVFAGFFVLANDYWAWNRPPVLWAGLPVWVWYYILLGVLLAGAYRLLLRDEEVEVHT